MGVAFADRDERPSLSEQIEGYADTSWSHVIICKPKTMWFSKAASRSGTATAKAPRYGAVTPAGGWGTGRPIDR